MCGLFGVATTEGRTAEWDRKQAFMQGLQTAEWRGKDASGIAVVHAKYLKEPAQVFKKAVRASDLLCMDQFHRMMVNFDDYAYVLGHARASTSERGIYADVNAHPFQFGPITMTHNGHITNTWQIGSGITHGIDSAHVAAALREKEAGEVLGSLLGAFALVWHDARDGSLNFARNTVRPLFWAYVLKENTMFWGSELEALHAVMKRNDIAIDGKFKFGTAFRHFKFFADDLRKVEVLPFVNAASQPMNHGKSNQHGEHSHVGPRQVPLSLEGLPMQNVQRFLPSKERDKNSTSTTTSGEDSTTGTILETTSSWSPPRNSSRPKSRRKVRELESRLRLHNLKLDNPQAFTPEAFRPYPGQKGVMGAIEGRDVLRGRKFVIENVPKTVWEQVNTHGKVYGRIANIRMKTGACTFVCDYDKAATEKYVIKPVQGGTGNIYPFRTDPLASEDEETEDLNPCRYNGPFGRKITEAEYRRRTKDGCHWCDTAIGLDDHEGVHYVGSASQPLCPSCTSNERIMADIGYYGVRSI